MFSDNSIFFLILDNINHFANSAAHIHDVHFYFRCPNALSENSNWKQLLLAENIPASFTQYKVQWRGYKELLFAYGFYANVLETIIEPVFLFETHNGEGNRIVFGDSDEVEIYASLPNSDEAMFIKNSGRTTNLLRIYGR